MKVLLLVIVSAATVSPVWNNDAAFNISLELQGDCSDQLTLICRHSDIPTDPNWIHNGTVEGGQLLSTAFPDVMYSVQSKTEHRVTISGVDNVQTLDGYIIQCMYSILGNLIKSNAVKYSFIPPDYQPTLSLMGFTPDFSERFSTFDYSFQESCNLYPRCIPYFSVEHTVSPQSPVNISFSGCSAEYTIHNLMRCVSYQSTATALIRSQRGNPVVMGDTVMQSPGLFTITSVSIGAKRDLINVTYMESESDCFGYPTERYTVDVDGVQVADLTADEFQSLAINHTNGSVTLSLPLLNQPLPENATTLNMTKYNTVPTNRSNVTGNTKMGTWGTSAVFDLSQESSAAMNDEGEVSVGGVVGAIISVTTIVVVITIAALVITRKQKAKECGTCDLEAANDVLDGKGGTPPSPARTDGTILSDFGTEDPHKAVVTPVLESGAGEQKHKGDSGVAQVADTTDGVVHIGQDCNPRNGPKPTIAKATKSKDYHPSVSCGRMIRPPATKDRTRQHGTTDEGCDGYKHNRRQQPKVDLTRGDTAYGMESQETTSASGDDASTALDHLSDDHSIPMV